MKIVPITTITRKKPRIEKMMDLIVRFSIDDFGSSALCVANA
jgi:hypothetical protein